MRWSFLASKELKPVKHFLACRYFSRASANFPAENSAFPSPFRAIEELYLYVFWARQQDEVRGQARASARRMAEVKVVRGREDRPYLVFRVLIEGVHLPLHFLGVCRHGLLLHLLLDILGLRVLHHVHGALDGVGRHALDLLLHLFQLLRSLRTDKQKEKRRHHVSAGLRKRGPKSLVEEEALTIFFICSMASFIISGSMLEGSMVAFVATRSFCFCSPPLLGPSFPSLQSKQSENRRNVRRKIRDMYERRRKGRPRRACQSFRGQCGGAIATRAGLKGMHSAAY